MKKFFIALLCIALACSVLAFTACGNDGSEQSAIPPVEDSSDSLLDEIFDAEGTGTTSDGLKYQKFISRSKRIKKAYITGYSGEEFNIEIPERIDGYTITEISDSAFRDSEVNSVSLPSSIEQIGNHAFRNCPFLSTVELGSVKAIGNSAFRQCPILTTVTLPETCTYLGESAFSECTSLVSVNIPSKVTELNNFVFNRCESLKQIIIPSTVTRIGDGVFYYCKSLENIQIPASVTSIGGSVFEGCESLKTANVNASWGKITERTFYGCYSLESIIIPEGIVFIEGNAFYGCLGLTSVKMPSTMQTIYSSAFYGCDNLQEVVLNEGVTTIYDNAFGSNYDAVSPGVMERHLTSVVIPSTVLKIERGAFCLGRSYINENSDVSYNDRDYMFGSGWTSVLAKVYCRVSSKPTAWADNWTNCAESSIVWGYTN